MSAKGDCYDNSPMESFFATLKKELIHRRRFKTREQAKIAIISYIETWYNPKRIRSSLGDMSPIEFERYYLLSQGLAAS
jgi:putative transposase